MIARTRAPIAVLGTILAAFLTTSTLRAQQMCTNWTMQGTYVLSQTGTAGTTPFAIVGEATYDGRGGGTVTATEMFGGTIELIVKAPATFTVNPDCSGSKTVGPYHFNFVITPDGKTITFIQTDSGVVSAGKAQWFARSDN
jgi:hypothetical protein